MGQYRRAINFFKWWVGVEEHTKTEEVQSYWKWVLPFHALFLLAIESALEQLMMTEFQIMLWPCSTQKHEKDYIAVQYEVYNKYG